MPTNRCVAFWACLSIAMGQWNHDHQLAGWMFFVLALYAAYGGKKNA